MEEIAIIIKEEDASSDAAILAIIQSSGCFNSLTGLDLFFQIQKERDSTRRRILDRISRVGRFNGSDDRQMQLQFKGSIHSEILTSEEIKGEGGTSMQVALVDASNGNPVVDGPYASGTIEIVLLKPDDTADSMAEIFEHSIVQGKKPHVLENAVMKLQRGVVDLRNIKFRHDANPGVFRLGARMADSTRRTRVKEAMTTRFTLKDYRRKYHMNHEVPYLKDAVSRLVHIGKRRAKRLQENKITTAEDFLIRIMTDPDGLRKILRLGPNEWKDTVDNARACSDEKVYCYADFEQKKGIVFNFCEQELGLHMNNQYAPKNIFSKNHEVEARELKESACRNWSAVKSCENENSAQEYLNGHLGRCWSPRDSPMPDCRGTHVTSESCIVTPESKNPLGAETSQVDISVDDFEISVPHFPFVVGPETASSARNRGREENLDPLIRLTIRSLLNEEVPCYSNYDGFLKDGYGECEVNKNNLAIETSGGSKGGHSRILRMRWGRLLCLSRWQAAGKKASSVWHNIKKQKVH